jgi:hypothetical protein
MAQSLHIREQAGRCRRLARDFTGMNLRDRLLSSPMNTPGLRDGRLGNRDPKRRFGRPGRHLTGLSALALGFSN